MDKLRVGIHGPFLADSSRHVYTHIKPLHTYPLTAYSENLKPSPARSVLLTNKYSGMEGGRGKVKQAERRVVPLFPTFPTSAQHHCSRSVGQPQASLSSQDAQPGALTRSRPDAHLTSQTPDTDWRPDMCCSENQNQTSKADCNMLRSVRFLGILFNFFVLFVSTLNRPPEIHSTNANALHMVLSPTRVGQCWRVETHLSIATVREGDKETRQFNSHCHSSRTLSDSDEQQAKCPCSSDILSLMRLVGALVLRRGTQAETSAGLHAQLHTSPDTLKDTRERELSALNQEP